MQAIQEKGKHTMCGAYLEWVTRKILSHWGQQVFQLFFNNGRRDMAVKYLLDEIDHQFRCGTLSFEETAECYNLLAPPQTRVRAFPQKHLEEVR